MTTVVLCDTSSSMALSTGFKTRIAVLRDVLAECTPAEFTGQVWQFDSFARRVPGPPYVPDEPSGGTDLTHALECVLGLRPRPLIVISDGAPNDCDSALEMAKRFSTHIIARFVGEDDNFAAIAFMRALAWCSDDGFGDFQMHHWDRPHALSSDLRRLLLRWEGAA